MSDDYIGEENIDFRYTIEDIERRVGPARKRLNQEITKNLEDLRHMGMSEPQLDLNSIIYSPDRTSTITLSEGILMDWETNSPISPVSPDHSTSDKQIVNTMGLISLVRDYVGRDMSEITDADSARKLCIAN